MRKQRSNLREKLRKIWCTNARRIVVGVAGCSIIIIGVACLILPGPGTLIIPLGFAVLAAEFLWIKRLMRQSKAFIKKQLPNSQASRVDRTFAWVRLHSEGVSHWLQVHVVRHLTPKRKQD